MEKGKSIILVTGATGQQGGAVAREARRTLPWAARGVKGSYRAV